MTDTIAIDIDPNEWTFFEQVDYRKAVGVNPHYALMKIGHTFESADSEEFANIPPEYLLGLAWITARRDEPGLTYDGMAERVNYQTLLDAVVEAAKARAEAMDPQTAPNRAARRAKTSTPRKTTSRTTKASTASASRSTPGPAAT